MSHSSGYSPWVRCVSALLIVAILCGLTPPLRLSPSARSSPPSSLPSSVSSPSQPFSSPPEPGVALASVAPLLAGHLLFAPEIDTDGDPATNPLVGVPLPVVRIGASQAVTPATYYAVIGLAVQVVPDEDWQNPAGTMVSFHLWNETAQVDIVRPARVDAWGAAHVEILLDDLHLPGDFSYRASAPGFGQTPLRSFRMDTTRYSSDTRLGAARLRTTVEPDGRLVAGVESDVPMDDDLDAVSLAVVRLTPAADGSSAPQREALPPLVARRLDTYHAQAEIYLEAGDYLLAAMASSQDGDVLAQSAPTLVHIEPFTPPPVGSVERVDAGDEDGLAWARYRTPEGDVALVRRSLDDLPPTQPGADEPKAFKQTVRTSAFEWHTEIYTLTTHVLNDDGNKRASLDGFEYDPLTRRYDIKIESLLTEAVEDTLTVQVLGPNGVVIYEETAPVVLDPAVPLHYQISVPSDRGEPYGLRVIVRDPLFMDWLITKTVEIAESIFYSIPTGEGLGIAFGVKASFTLLYIELLSASMLCTTLDGCREDWGGFFGPFIKGEGDSIDWIDYITTTITDYLRDKFLVDSLEEALQKILEGIDIGSVAESFTLGVRGSKAMVKNYDCLTDESKETVKEAVGAIGQALGQETAIIGALLPDIFEDLKENADIKAPVSPAMLWLLLKASPILAFKIVAGASEYNDYSLYLEGQIEVGVSVALTVELPAADLAELIEKLAKIAKFIETFYQLMEGIRAINNVVKIFIASANLKLEYKPGCEPPPPPPNDPPPPNGHPDDRRDAPDNEPLAVIPPGASGQIAYIQRQLATASRMGLQRAAVYWTLQLREQEVAEFTNDTARVLSRTAEIETAYNQAEYQIQGLISGTIPLTGTQTLTEAVMLAYGQFFTDTFNTSYDLERQALLDSLAFAKRHYDELRGHELELQRELRLMASGALGVIDSGMVKWALGAIGSVGIEAVPVQIVAGVSSSGLPDSRYYSPYQAPPVMIAPTGSLYRLKFSQQARDWLETYVAGGGTLIVLAQADNADWEMLPGGQVQGLGYREDILCKTGSVRLANPSLWIQGIDRDLPDIQIDGSFTDWPNTATIVLIRTTGNQMPAMIEYPYGDGLVVATSAYPDWYINGLQSVDDIVFARSLFAQAYLLGQAEPVADVAEPGQPVQVSLQVTNTTALTISQVAAWGDYYDSHIGDSWRWAYHQPHQLGANQRLVLDPPLPSGASRQIALNFAAPQRAGLFRMGYFLGNVPGGIMGFMAPRPQPLPGPFYQVRSSQAFSTTLPLFVRLWRDQADYAYGATAALTASLKNGSPTTRTLALEPSAGLLSPPFTVTLDPGQQAVYTFSPPVYAQAPVTVSVREAGRLLSVVGTTLRLRLPILGVMASPQHAVSGLTTTLVVTATVAEQWGEDSLDWEVRYQGSLVTSTTTTLSAADGYSLTQATFQLPPGQVGAAYTVRARLPDSGAAMTQTLPVVAPGRVLAAEVARSPVIGGLTLGGLNVVLSDAARPGLARVQVLLQQDDQVLARGPVAQIPIGVGPHTGSLDVLLPDALSLGQGYNIVVSATSQVTGLARLFTSTLVISLPLQSPAVALQESTHKVGHPLNVLVTTKPRTVGMPETGVYTLTLEGIATPFSHTIVLPAGAPVLSHTLLLTTVVPDLTHGGPYRVKVQSARLSGWQALAVWYLADSRLAYTLPPSVNAGGELVWQAGNVGGLHTSLTGTLTLLDDGGVIVAQSPVSAVVPVDASAFVTLTLPTQLASGDYRLRWRGYDHLERWLHPSWGVSVQGLDVALESHTLRQTYWTWTMEGVDTMSAVTSSDTLTDAQLRLQVIKYDPEKVNVTTLEVESGGVTSTNWFNRPSGLALSVDGDFALVADTDNHVIWRVNLATMEGQVLAGAVGQSGSADGVGAAARFDSPSDVSMNAEESYALVADTYNCTIRRLDLATGEVTTLAGSAKVCDFVDGAYTITARFDYPRGVAVSPDGTLALVADTYNGTMRVLDFATQVVTSPWGGPNNCGSLDSIHSSLQDWSWCTPVDVDISADGAFALVADSQWRCEIDRIDMATLTVTQVSGSGCGYGPFDYPEGVSLSADGRFALVADKYNQVMRWLDVASGQVTTLAGSPGEWGNADGPASLARFNEPLGVAWSRDGAFALVADSSNNALRRLDFNRTYSLLREDWLPVAGSGVLTYPYALSGLESHPLARGVLFLEGQLFSRDPAGTLAAQQRHSLAVAPPYPFAIYDSGGGLSSERAIYRADAPDYALDDVASAHVLHGMVPNMEWSTQTITINVDVAGSTIFAHVCSDVASYDTCVFTTTHFLPHPSPEAVTYTLTNSLYGDTPSVSVLSLPASLTVANAISPTQIVLGEAAALEVVLTNTGRVPAFETVDMGAGPQAVNLEPGQSLSLTGVLTPSQAGLLHLPITLTGDVSRTDVLALNVHAEMATTMLALAGPGRDSSTLLQTDAAGLQLTMTNTQVVSFEAVLEYSLLGPQARTGSAWLSLPPGSTVFSLSLAAMPAGAYTAAFTLSHARLGALLATVSRTFSLAAPQWALSLDAQAGLADAQGLLPFEIVVESDPTSDPTWSGHLALSGAAEAFEPVALDPGGRYVYTGALALRDMAGPQAIRADLMDVEGQVVLSRMLQVDAAPRYAPGLTLAGLAASEASPGGQVVFTITLDNSGPAGDALLSVMAFDQEYTMLAEASGFGRSQAVLQAPVPAGLLMGVYPLRVDLGEQTLRVDVPVVGVELNVTHSLDAPVYAAFSEATWTVVIEGVSGAPADYDVSLRYDGAEYTQTIHLATGQSVTLPWTFEVGPVSTWASVLVSNHPLDESQPRYNLVIDTHRVAVIEDPRVWLESDKDRYSAGETATLTLHLLQPTRLAMVLAPEGLLGQPLLRLWSSVELSSTQVVTGDFVMTYTFPATLPTGRYAFRYSFEGEEGTLLVDVFGSRLLIEEMCVQPAGQALRLEDLRRSSRAAQTHIAPGDPLTITAGLRLDTPLPQVRIWAYALGPDGGFYDLGVGARLTTSLLAGLTSVTVTGVLSATWPGSYQIVLEVHEASSGVWLGGDSCFVDAGQAMLNQLSVDRGVYAPGQAGIGTVTFYGADRADVRVRTSDGTPLLAQTLNLAGFQALTFTLPTADERDEVLIAVLTDSLGMTSSLQAAYKVAASFDITAPQVVVLTPTSGALIEIQSPGDWLTLAGVVTEEVALESVLINGLTATLHADGRTFSQTVALERGMNMFQVAARDAAGNLGLALHTLRVEPAHGVSLVVTPTDAAVGDVITYQAVLTSAGVLTATAMFPFSLEGLAPLAGSATSGTLTLGEVGEGVIWHGVITSGLPVTVQWSAEATQAMTRSLYVVLQGESTLPRLSNGVETHVETPSAVALQRMVMQRLTGPEHLPLILLGVGLLAFGLAYRRLRRRMCCPER